MRDILERRPPPFDKRITYGPEPENFGELRFPKGSGPFSLMLMIHGGFWQAAYDLKHTGHLCADLTSNGIVTCNLEYRRIGNVGGGWPGTFQDISLASIKIPEILGSDPRVDTTRMAVMGHSAGGQLALWMVSRHKVSKKSPLYDGREPLIRNAISLAGVADLRTAWRERLGHGIVTRFLDGSPTECPERYDAASPIELLPNKANHVLIHGTADGIVPFSQSEIFAKKAKQLGEHVNLVRCENTGHFELIDPESEVWLRIVEAGIELLERKGRVSSK